MTSPFPLPDSCTTCGLLMTATCPEPAVIIERHGDSDLLVRL